MLQESRYYNLRYQAFKAAARKIAYERVKAEPGFLKAGIDPAMVRYDAIDAEAIAASHLWGAEVVLYPWENVRGWKRKDPRGLDVSLWYGKELCGLCYATPRKSSICIKVILLEGKPNKFHPLRGVVASLAIVSIDIYARMLGCEEIEIQEPSQGAAHWYLELGFEYNAQGRLVMPVKA
ncbi:MAG: N-acetyltransferase [Pseudomonas sp.]|uniref:N-acetyltransferase n=1 Tax=Pseudomonas abieticivorans TaxID=2931382 RepID=UPI0020C16FBA|nr:N-acetyltransferase [Pseudomonas sp. PIA16]MDE1168016.1 N-acetyltransferase [Pseudomonas sp.]